MKVPEHSHKQEAHHGVRSSDLLAAAEMLQTISSSGYSAEYERGWNAAVRHNRYVLKCAGGDQVACAAIGKYPKAANDKLSHTAPTTT